MKALLKRDELSQNVIKAVDKFFAPATVKVGKTLLSKHVPRSLITYILFCFMFCMFSLVFPAVIHYISEKKQSKICTYRIDYHDEEYDIFRKANLATASAGITSFVLQILRYFSISASISEDIEAIILMNCAVTFISVSLPVISIFFESTFCIDGLGLLTPLLQWFEWIVSVPLLMYISVTIDPHKNVLQAQDRIVLGCTTMSMVVAFVASWGLSRSNAIFCYIMSSVLLAIALYLAFYDSLRSYNLSLNNIQKQSRASVDFTLSETLLKLTKMRLNATIAICINFTMFPTIFLLGWRHFLKTSHVLAIISCLDLCSKQIIILALSDYYVSNMDPRQIALIAEKAANDARREYLRYVFHEVRIPLNSIYMALHILSTNEMNMECVKSLKMMNDAVKFMDKTLNDVLSMQKIEDGKFDMVLDVCKTEDIAQNATTTLFGEIHSKEIKLDVQFAKDVPEHIVADQFRLEHVLVNLISNAIKYSDHGSEIRVIIAALKDSLLQPVKIISVDKSYRVPSGINYDALQDCVIKFTVVDKGIGISKQDQLQLFQVYGQIQPETFQARKGYGVGLSLCKEIVTKHNGEIGVRSDPESYIGSEFYFSIPAKVFKTNDNKQGTSSNSDTRSVDALSQKTSGYAYGAGKLNILVVDDTNTNRKLLTMMLQKASKELSIDSADCGKAAIEAVKVDNKKYHIIFLDNIMPDISGHEVANILRSELHYENLIIGLTGDGLEVDIRNFEAAGADIALTKPLLAEELYRLLDHCHNVGVSTLRNLSVDSHEYAQVESLRNVRKNRVKSSANLMESSMKALSTQKKTD
jgi:signal transduction histidine kinase/DNA-binding NarL/FixJ family response regulator